MNPAPLDGNVTAGDLADIFAFDATTAITTCATCRQTHPIATLRAYVRAPGMVLRCASCDAVQIRLVRAPNEDGSTCAASTCSRSPSPGDARDRSRARSRYAEPATSSSACYPPRSGSTSRNTSRRAIDAPT